MYAVIRQYSGASQLSDELESRKDVVERVIRGVPGLVSYTLLRTDYGGISVTVCQDKAGTDDSKAGRRGDRGKHHGGVVGPAHAL